MDTESLNLYGNRNSQNRNGNRISQECATKKREQEIPGVHNLEDIATNQPEANR